jgi:cob(I)alamin adenosyltransferase
MRTKIYTKGGDKGETSLFGGSRVSKGHRQIEMYGSIDELNAVIGLCVSELTGTSKNNESSAPRIANLLKNVQNELFNIGSHLACGDDKLRVHLPALSTDLTHNLENEIDAFTDALPELREFILPGGSMDAAFLHLARTVCRRAERELVRFQESDTDPSETTHLAASSAVVFLNRLSDYLFVASRMINHDLKVSETKWQKGAR